MVFARSTMYTSLDFLISWAAPLAPETAQKGETEADYWQGWAFICYWNLCFFSFSFSMFWWVETFGGVSSAPCIIPKHALRQVFSFSSTQVTSCWRQTCLMCWPVSIRCLPQALSWEFKNTPQFQLPTLHNFRAPLNKEGTSTCERISTAPGGPRAKLPRCGVLGFSLCFSCWLAWPSNPPCFLAVAAWSLKLFNGHRKERWCWTCRNWFVICDVVEKMVFAENRYVGMGLVFSKFWWLYIDIYI